MYYPEYYPSAAEVVHLAKDYNFIPVMRDVLADTETPIRVFQHFFTEKRSFLLESVEGGAKWARYSFIGTDPFLIVTAKDGVTSVENGDGVAQFTEPPLTVLKKHLQKYSSPDFSDLPRFTGGAVGYFGYDLLKYYESLPEHRTDDLQMNDIQFMFCDQVIVFDHMKQQVKVIANVRIPNQATAEDITDAYQKTCHKIDAMIAKLQNASSTAMTINHNSLPKEIELGEIRSNMSKQQFMDNVNKAKEYIYAGEIQQVVLSQRFELATEASPLQVYRILRTMNPSPYMYCLKMDDEVIVGTSPELLVRVENDKVQTKPIAGTRPRGATPEHDAALEKELLADKKDRAEHIMLVDLGREDLLRVSEPDSVVCDSYMEIERYSHVMHIVSNVSGKLRRDKDSFDAFLACLPAGTVSGAPKLRAMEIIAELENEARGPYAGAIGYLGFSGNLDTCITIRTIIFKNGKAYVQAGAGIVQDSVPESEYEETVNKAKAMVTSIRMAEAVFHKSSPQETIAVTNRDYF